MKVLRVLLLLAAVVPLGVAAFSPAEHKPRTSFARNGRYCFEMIPEVRAAEPVDGFFPIVQEAYGIAYEIALDGTRKESWRVEGWYSFLALLAEDGRYLVRLEPDIEEHCREIDGDTDCDSKPTTEDIALEFYNAGTLLRQYRVTELVGDLETVGDYGGGYRWCNVQPWDGAHEFRVITSDNILYRFDFRTGDILERRPPEMLEPFVGASPQQLQQLAIAIGLVPYPLPVSECEQSLALANWNRKTLHEAPTGAQPCQYLLVPITSTDDQRGYFELKLEVSNYTHVSESLPETGEIDGIQLLFHFPDNSSVDCIGSLSRLQQCIIQEAREHETSLRELFAKHPDIKRPPLSEKPMPACKHWFSVYYKKKE